MTTVLINIIIPILAALLGGFVGAWFQNLFLQHRTNKVRKIAIRGLRVFKKYAKDGQTYDIVASDFNNELNVVEKRAVLVALCKLGIPVVKPVDNVFDIAHIRFEHVVISKDSLFLMTEQINKGNCDTMFFSDVDEYFSSNSRLYATRAVAKKYVDIDLSKCSLEKNNQQITHPTLTTTLFTPGELNVLNVFRYHTNLDTYFDGTGKADQSKMQQLKKEIDLGLWDTYLFWDWEAYQSVRNQNNMAVVFANVMQNNSAQQCTTQIDNKDRVELNTQQASDNH